MPAHTKVCTTCFERKPLEGGFYKHKATADGFLHKCKECHKRAMREHRDKNIEKIRVREALYARKPEVRKRKAERLRRYRRKQPERSSVSTKKWRLKNPKKYKAHTAVSNAVRDGRLVKPPNCACGNSPVQAHHANYSKPLEVDWLCVDCHKALHRKHH